MTNQFDGYLSASRSLNHVGRPFGAVEMVVKGNHAVGMEQVKHLLIADRPGRASMRAPIGRAFNYTPISTLGVLPRKSVGTFAISVNEDHISAIKSLPVWVQGQRYQPIINPVSVAAYEDSHASSK
jgi:hypothetical protein